MAGERTLAKNHLRFRCIEYPSGGFAPIAHGQEFSGLGKVWLDNFVLYRNDAKHENRLFIPHEVSFDEFIPSVPETEKKPALRTYSLIEVSESVQPIEMENQKTVGRILQSRWLRRVYRSWLLTENRRFTICHS